MNKLSNRQKRILKNIVNADGWITARQMSIEFNVTDRTIKSDMNYISNELENQGIAIVSHRGKGFRVNEEDRNRLLTILEDKYEDENLLSDILMTLLEVDEISVAELCELYYVSMSFIVGKLREIRNFFIQEGNFLVLVKVKSALRVDGAEKKKRQMMQLVIINNQNTLNLQAYTKYLELDMLKFHEKLLLSGVEKYKIWINDINIVRIAIYLSIMTERVSKGYVLREGGEKNTGKEIVLADEIADKISEKYSIQIPLAERTALASYIAMNRILGIGVKAEEIREGDREYFLAVKEIINGIKDEFLLNLTKDEELTVGLSYHVKRLISRKSGDDKYINPILNDLRDNYPYIYEVAIYFGQCLKKKMNLCLDENEIGCVAIHLAAAIERIKNIEYREPINILVVCHMGYTNMQFLTTKLKSMYLGDVIFQPVISSYHLKNIKGEKIDLILSTTPIDDVKVGCPVIYINPYLTKRDIERINDILFQKYHLVYGEDRKQQYFISELFFPRLSFRTQEEVIQYLTNILLEKGYVQKGFFESSMRREKLSSTASQNLIAIPHALENMAKKTGIAVASLEKPVKWGSRSAQLIFMLSVRKEDKKYLKEFYELFVNLTEDIKLVEKLVNAKNFEEFQKIILR